MPKQTSQFDLYTFVAGAALEAGTPLSAGKPVKCRQTRYDDDTLFRTR